MVEPDDCRYCMEIHGTHNQMFPFETSENELKCICWSEWQNGIESMLLCLEKDSRPDQNKISYTFFEPDR